MAGLWLNPSRIMLLSWATRPVSSISFMSTTWRRSSKLPHHESLAHGSLKLRSRLWEALGFSKAGLIPSAGRLRTRDGKGEEYIDAYVFYKSFQQ